MIPVWEEQARRDRSDKIIHRRDARRLVPAGMWSSARTGQSDGQEGVV